VGEAKQIHVVLEALAADPDLARRIHYEVVGEHDPLSDYVQLLRRLIEEGGLSDCVELTGAVSNRDVDVLLDWADVFVGLRWPSTEGGSASLVEQLITGRPIVVTRIGVFDELPEHAAWKVPPDDPEAVRSALRALLDDPELRVRIGSAGRQFASALTVESYSRALASFLESCRPGSAAVITR
jgi:glycosyltransferase involved in cell wall biosynthesis